jgi:hypothetical protein
MLARTKKDSTAHASVVDGKLILSLPEALTPIVWQIDLGDAKSSAFEVIEESGQYKLISKKQGAQKKETIAPFADKNKAVEALMATSHALAHAHGHIHNNPPANVSTPGPAAYTHISTETSKSGGGKWIFAVASIVLIIGLFYMANTMQPRSPSSMVNASANNNNTAPNSASQAGVPVSADDFLRSR